MGLPVEWHWAGDGKWPSVKATLKGSDPSAKSLLLTGHLDTVAVTEGWKTDPFTPVVDGDRVYALGASDMKGGLAAILEAVNRFIEKSGGGGHKNKGDLHLAFVADEEGLSRGMHKMLKDGLTADMAIMAECRFKNIAIGFRGRYSFMADVSGVAAHASIYPGVGRNAIIDAAKLALAVENLPTAVHPEAGAGTWCVRHIEGGIKTTLSVPDKCGVFIDRYVVPGESAESCIEQVREAANSLGIGDRVNVALTKRETPFMESFVIDRDHPLLLSVLRHFREVAGCEASLEMDRSVCDSNYLVVLGGIPTVTFGPSGEGLHGPNEFGSIKEIDQAAEIYERVIGDIIC
jgi:succinyl-diaminopimelate desuccinylase